MISIRVLNPFGNDSLTLFQMTKKTLDWSKLEAFSDVKINVTKD